MKISKHCASVILFLIFSFSLSAMEKLLPHLSPSDHLRMLLGSINWSKHSQHIEDEIKHYVQRGADPNTATNPHGSTALAYAVKFNLFGLAVILLEKGADPNHLDSNKANVLCNNLTGYEAVTNDIINLLIDYGLDISNRNIMGQTAVALAKQFEHQNAIEIFTNRRCLKIP